MVQVNRKRECREERKRGRRQLESGGNLFSHLFPSQIGPLLVHFLFRYGVETSSYLWLISF